MLSLLAQAAPWTVFPVGDLAVLGLAIGAGIVVLGGAKVSATSPARRWKASPATPKPADASART